MQFGRRQILCGCLACFNAALLRPATANDAGIKPLVFEEIADDIYLHTSWGRFGQGYFPSNGIAVIGRDRVVLIDTAWTPEQTTTLLARVDEASGGLPIDLVVSHAHDDRMGGIGICQGRSITSLAHILTVEQARRAGLGGIERSFGGSTHALDLGGRRVELFHPGSAHTKDNIVAYIPDASVLFGGCMIRSLEQSGLGNVADADLCAWPQSVRAVQQRFADARVVAPGHGELGDGALLAHTLLLAQSAKKPACGAG